MNYYTPTFPTTYNPMYQRPAQQMPQIQPMMQQPIQPQPNYICRPVASEEEARAVPTDFSGGVLVLVDQAHGKIYTKSLNYNDGSAIFMTYSLPQAPVEAPAPLEPAPDYATKEELHALSCEIADLKGALGL